AEIASIKNRELLEKLGVAYEILDNKRVLALFMPNQSFLMTVDFRAKMLKEAGEWDNKNWFIIKTTASALSWDDWARAQGVPVVNTPVGFKEIASIMKKVEKQIREAPDKPVIIEDIFGNKINLGIQPRLLFAGEESGGEIFGPTELIESVNGRKAIAMREKSAGEAMVITSAMASYLEGRNTSLVEYLNEIFEENNIVNRYDYREDIIYFNESEPNIAERKREEAKGLKKKKENDYFYLAIAIAIREGKITFEEAKAFLQKTFPGVNFEDLQAIHFIGDGVYLKFAKRIIEIRPSGTEAKTKGYGLGNELGVLIDNAKVLAVYYQEDMRESLKELLGEETHAEYFEMAEFMGTKMPAVKVKALEIYNEYLAKDADTKPFVPPVSYEYLYTTPQEIISISHSEPKIQPDERLLARIKKMVSTLKGKSGKWAAEQFKDKITMLGWTTLASSNWLRNFILPEGVPNAGKSMLSAIKAFGEEVRQSDTTDVVFIGQGGSIECIKTLRDILGTKEGSPKVHCLDTVDNDVINALQRNLNLGTTRFVAISKSMTTMETISLYKLFFDLYPDKAEARNHFTFISNEGKTFESNPEVAKRGAKNIFYIKNDVGGRYSWDTSINLLTASIMGHDVEELLRGAAEMEELSHNPNLEENPAAQYALFKYLMQLEGRNRPVLLLPGAYEAYGPWNGQLDVESLGKEDRKSSLTIDHPVLTSDLAQGTQKRFFVRIKTGENDTQYDELIKGLESKDYPTFTITIPSDISRERALAQLLKMSEFATAYTGYLMGVNPVNQPGVEEYKKMQKQYLAEGEEAPTANFVKEDNLTVDYNAAIGEGKIKINELERALETLGKKDAAATMAALLYLAAKENQRDYAAMLIFKRLTESLKEMQNEWRVGVTKVLGIDTLAEEAPCILHAKQQGFQQGENSGFFTIVRFLNYQNPVEIPDIDHTFAELINAQAKGTLEALSKAGRPGVLVSVKDTGEASLSDLNEIMKATIENLNYLSKAEILRKIRKAEKIIPKPEMPLEQVSESKREFVGAVEGYVIEKYTIHMGDTLASEPLAFDLPQKLFIKEGEIALVDEKDSEIAKATKGEFIEAPLGKYEIYGTATSVVYLEYEPGKAESQVIAGFEAVRALLTRESFTGAKPVIVHEPTTMHAKNSFIHSKNLFKSKSDNTVDLHQYGRTVDDLIGERFDPAFEHVFAIYTDDLERIQKDGALRKKLQNVLTQKIIPVRRPADETKGVSNAIEIETAAVVLGLTDVENINKEQLSGNAVTLQRIMSSLVGEDISAEALLALMGGAVNKIAERIDLMLKKLVPLTEEIRREVRARRELLWSL
ncbi:MAG: hypothetical protein WBC74_01030, partial [Candidatus Omnitrophota bacterium]